jgi:hypothetical protein
MNRLPNHIKKRMLLLLLSGMGLVMSCTKGFLDKKPSSDLVVPTTLEDFQALLDNDLVMSGTPELGELSADNFYLLDDFWTNLDTKEHNAYIWAKDIYNGQGNVDDWNQPYQQVFYANVVLDGLPGVPTDSMNQQEWKALKGAACFFRAYAFYNIAQVFAPVYNTSTALTDPGIPLRLSSDINPVSTRASVKSTYDQILSDLKQASSLLPAAISFNNLNRPSKAAALAMLARVYLSMGSYAQAGIYADSSLRMYADLVDFSLANPASNFPFLTLSPNVEILYESQMVNSTAAILGVFDPECIVDSNLFSKYGVNDLRRSIYYKLNGSGLPYVRAGYSSKVYAFTGLATDEQYLIRAECYARMGSESQALNDLDTLLQKRFVHGSFNAYTVANTPDPLALILAERRKELAFRGLRWTDLRRFNNEGDTPSITLFRIVNGANHLLIPKDENYVLPIPPDVIALSGIAQNPRH